MKKFKILTSGFIGTTLEIYDFTLYGVLSIVISYTFLPSDDPTAALLATLGIFATGFIMRPIGGLVLGHIGDRYGRKKALSLAILLMAIPTFLIGVLPAYNQIGILAPVILILCRLLQGFCAGGEFNGASIFVIEHMQNSRAGFYGAIINSANALGGLLAMFVGAIALMPDMPSWSWRVCFILGSAIGIVGLYVRKRVDESPEFEEACKKVSSSSIPIKEAICESYGSILCAIGMAACGTAYIYMQLVYMNIYLTKVVGIAINKSMFINSIGLVAIIFFTPFIGHLSDKLGRKSIMITFATLGLVLAYPIFMLLQIGSLWSIILPQIILGLIFGGYTGPMHAYLAELFPVRSRYSGVTLGFCLGQAVFGGITPFVATYLIEVTQNPLSPAFYLMICSFIGIVAALSANPKISWSLQKRKREQEWGVLDSGSIASV